MSSENSLTNGSPLTRQKTILIGSGIVFGVVIIIAVASFFLGKHQGSKNLSAVPEIATAPSSYQRVLGAQTNSWEGKITSVSSRAIVFVPTNGDQKDQKLTARITDDTQLMRWDLSQSPDSAQPSGTRTPITITEFKTGATIYVQASVEGNNPTQFDALAVSLLIKPTSH